MLPDINLKQNQDIKQDLLNDLEVKLRVPKRDGPTSKSSRNHIASYKTVDPDATLNRNKLETTLKKGPAKKPSLNDFETTKRLEYMMQKSKKQSNAERQQLRKPIWQPLPLLGQEDLGRLYLLLDGTRSGSEGHVASL